MHCDELSEHIRSIRLSQLDVAKKKNFTVYWITLRNRDHLNHTEEFIHSLFTDLDSNKHDFSLTMYLIIRLNYSINASVLFYL